MRRKSILWGMVIGVIIYAVVSLIGFLVAQFGPGSFTGYIWSVILMYIANGPAILCNAIYMAITSSTTSLFNSSLGFLHPALIVFNIVGWGILGIIFGLISTLFRKRGVSPPGY